MWIEKVDKHHYMDSSTRGLRLYFGKDVNGELKSEIINFCKWLRSEYYFPLRILVKIMNWDIIVLSSEEECVGVFACQDNWDEKKDSKKKLPKIYVAVGKFDKQLKKHGFVKTLHKHLTNIVHELTHYYQWYFYEFENRTDRSLEIEANKWGLYLAGEYIFKNHEAKEIIDL